MQFELTRMLGGVARSLAALALWLGVGFAPAYAGKRVALVIGNSAYTHLAPLSNPHHDARAVAELLKSLGWDVIEGLNLSFVQLHDAVAELEGKASGADVALVYYAGHGLSYQNRDFVAPTDMPEHCANDALKRVFPLERLGQRSRGRRPNAQGGRGRTPQSLGGRGAAAPAAQG